MTRCAKFHHLFDEVGDFCGMSPSAISQYKAYREQVKKLVNLGIDEDFVFENFPEGPGRILSGIKDDETRTKALNYVAARLKRKEKVTEGDLRKTLKSWNPATCSVNARSGNFTNVKSSPPKTDVKPKNTDEKKPPEHFFAPLADGKPVDPPATLAESMKEEEGPATPATAPVQKPTENVEEVPCKAGKPCPTPDGRSYLIVQQHLGNKCGACGSYLANLSYCPVLQREKAARANGGMFTTAAALIKATTERAPAELPRTARNEPRRVTVDFTEKQWSVLKQVQREDLAGSFEDAIRYLVDEAGERMGGR